jgi:hypothetical protein
MANRRAVPKDAARLCGDSDWLWSDESSSMVGLASMNQFRLWSLVVLLTSGDVRKITMSYIKYDTLFTEHGASIRAHLALGQIWHPKKPLYLQQSSRSYFTWT